MGNTNYWIVYNLCLKGHERQKAKRCFTFSTHRAYSNNIKEINRNGIIKDFICVFVFNTRFENKTKRTVSTVCTVRVYH